MRYLSISAAEAKTRGTSSHGMYRCSKYVKGRTKEVGLLICRRAENTSAIYMYAACESRSFIDATCYTFFSITSFRHSIELPSIKKGLALH